LTILERVIREITCTQSSRLPSILLLAKPAGRKIRRNFKSKDIKQAGKRSTVRQGALPEANNSTQALLRPMIWARSKILHAAPLNVAPYEA
jgi:hypothetical protein